MARFKNGWIKIHRSILENVVSQRDIFTFGVFNRLLAMANWKESKIIFGGKKITLQPGQLVTGLRELSPDIEEDPYLHRIRNALSYLVLCEAIEQATSNQGRLITICNWDKYQNLDDAIDDESASDAQTTRKRCASDAQLSEEGKKERREEVSHASALFQTWKETLKHRGADRDLYSFEQVDIARRSTSLGAEAVDRALYGFRFETGFDGFDPKQNTKLSRVWDSLDKWINLAASNRPVKREVVEWEFKC